MTSAVAIWGLTQQKRKRLHTCCGIEAICDVHWMDRVVEPYVRPQASDFVTVRRVRNIPGSEPVLSGYNPSMPRR